MDHYFHPYSNARREFLKGVVGGGALAGAAMTGAAAAMTPRPLTPGTPATARPARKGYRETAHIRRYYELARR